MMEKYFKRILLSLAMIMTTIIASQAQTIPNTHAPWEKKNPWTEGELIQPSELASLLKQAKKPLIFNIGIVDDIKGAKNMGAAREAENLEKFKETLSSLPKNTFFVYYCGCCPFSKCPNVRPAYQLVKELGFKNAQLLNLPVNLKTDWINKGYPLEEK